MKRKSQFIRKMDNLKTAVPEAAQEIDMIKKDTLKKTEKLQGKRAIYIRSYTNAVKVAQGFLV